MDKVTLEDVIRQHIRLPGRPNSRGFYSVLCKVCNDHGHKGPRAGFKFDGEAVGYNCFNCGHTAVFDPHESRTISKKMTEVLTAFGLVEADWQPVLYHLMLDAPTSNKNTPSRSSMEPKEVQLPKCAVPLIDDGNEWNVFAIDYLKNNRGVRFTDYPFYIVNEITDHPDSKRWYGRLIIPVYKDNKLVYYQGRDLSDTRVKKYLSPSIDRENVLYGYDRLFDETDEPLYVMEGWFDAYHAEGVAVFHHHMSQNQVKWLQRSRRTKVVVPDRWGDGHKLAEQAIDLGWSVSYPDIGSCKDVNDAIMKYGKLYTFKTLRDNTCSGFEAESRLGIYCVSNNNGK